MSISGRNAALDRIKSTPSQSPLAVWRITAGMWDLCFANTAKSQWDIAQGYNTFCGLFHREVERHVINDRMLQHPFADDTQRYRFIRPIK